MSFRRLTRVKSVYLFMAVWMFCLGILPGNAQGALVSSQEMAPAVSAQRIADLEKINSLLAKDVVSERLARLGLGQKEIAATLARLDDARLHQIALEADKIEKGAGDTLLVIALLVLVVWGFIYLAGYKVKLEPREKSRADY